MAYLVKRKGGWLVRWREGGRGAPVQSSELLPTKADAKRRAEAVEADLARRHAPGVGVVISWAELGKRWRDAMVAAQRTERYAEDGERRLSRISVNWPPLDKLTRAHLAALKVGELRIAKAALGWARRFLDQPVPDILDARPAKPQARKPRADLVSPEQVNEWIAMALAISPPGAAMAHLIATYGHRAQSLVGMPCGSFDLGQTPSLTIKVKGGDIVRHGLLPATVAILRPILDGRDPAAPAFLGPDGLPWTDGRAWALWWWRYVSKGSGYYELKRFAITRMLDGGIDVVTVASITGHRTPSLLLNTYARTNEARQQAALDAIQAAQSGAHLVRTA